MLEAGSVRPSGWFGWFAMNAFPSTVIGHFWVSSQSYLMMTSKLAIMEWIHERKVFLNRQKWGSVLKELIEALRKMSAIKLMAKKSTQVVPMHATDSACVKLVPFTIDSSNLIFQGAGRDRKIEIKNNKIVSKTNHTLSPMVVQLNQISFSLSSLTSSTHWLKPFVRNL